MQLPVMITAQRHRKLVTNLSAQSWGLRKFDVIGVARRALADQIWFAKRRRPDESCFAIGSTCAAELSEIRLTSNHYLAFGSLRRTGVNVDV
jgi:hypothetical protein